MEWKVGLELWRDFNARRGPAVNKMNHVIYNYYLDYCHNIMEDDFEDNVHTDLQEGDCHTTSQLSENINTTVYLTKMPVKSKGHTERCTHLPSPVKVATPDFLPQCR